MYDYYYMKAVNLPRSMPFDSLRLSVAILTYCSPFPGSYTAGISPVNDDLIKHILYLVIMSRLLYTVTYLYVMLAWPPSSKNELTPGRNEGGLR